MTRKVIMAVIFVAFIGLGIPDSLLGSAWPAMYPDLGLPVSRVSLISMLVSLGTITSSFLSQRLVSRLGTAWVSVLSTLLTVLGLLGFSLSEDLLSLCLCAIPLGLGAGSIDAALNSYAAGHFSAASMSFLHCFYGVGVALSPYLMSVILGGGLGWRSGYRVMFGIQLGILAVLALSLPLWRRAAREEEAPQAEEKPAPVKLKTLLRIPAVRVHWLVLVGSCGIEAACLVWGGTFLVDARGLSPQLGARIITCYFLGITVGRFVSGLAVRRIPCERVIRLGQGVTLAAIAVLLLSRGAVMAMAGLFLVGLGNGPVFPNMTQLTTKYYGAELSGAVISTQMGFSYVSFLLVPILFGRISAWLGIGCFPAYLGALFLLMAASTAALRRRVAGKEAAKA